MSRTSWDYTGSTSPWSILLECNKNNPSLDALQTFTQYTQALKQHYNVSLSPPKNSTIIIRNDDSNHSDNDSEDDDDDEYETLKYCATPKSPNFSQHRRSQCTNLAHITTGKKDENLSGIIKIKEYEDYIDQHNNPSKRKKKKKSKKNKKKNIQKEAPLLITESNSCDLWDSYVATPSATVTSKNAHTATPKSQKLQKQKISPIKVKMSENNQNIAKKIKAVKKEKKSNLLDPKYRKKKREKKEAENLSFTGFKIRTKRRYRIDDGRIGICMFRGRTVFGKAYEDWIGIMVEHGHGDHNGSVDGHSYFRCANGKGIMVRPQRIVQDLGMPNGTKLSQKVIEAYPYKEIEEAMRKKGMISQ